MPSPNSFQAPTGLRDFYPAELLRRRWLEAQWRQVSINFGFDEIDGPTFETTDLYTTKSGEGIVSEIFGVFSGKDEERLKLMAGRITAGQSADAPYALRPEFTPTLARMFAARAGQLPKPTKWFWQNTCFRAERPQKGRLREFLQWNCDLIGDNSPAADAEIIAVCVGLLARLGLKPTDVKVRYSSRQVLASILRELGITADQEAAAFVLLDRREKLDDADLEAMAFEFGINSFPFLQFLRRPRGASSVEASLEYLPLEVRAQINSLMAPLTSLMQELAAAGISEWCELDLNIARGLAYYTGMVFEVHEVSGGMRAVAGGGRYDGLIETFGGPSTPAVGFGMGDVVLSLVLADRNLLPTEKQVASDLGVRPDVFVISNGTPEAEAQVAGVIAQARSAGLHARKSYKATKNIGKLLKDAGDLSARFAVIIESGTEATLKNLESGTQDRVPISEIMTKIAR